MAKKKETIKWEGKLGKYCPLQFINKDGNIRNKTCNDMCAWYSDGIKACVLFSISFRLHELVKAAKES